MFQALGVVVPLAEPAVVQHQHLHTEARGPARDLQDFVSGEIEIRGFPVVDEHRAGNVPVLAPAHMAAQGAVIIVGQGRKPRAGVGKNHLRGRKAFAGSQRPGELPAG